jgi:hypothetical protein
MPRDTNLGTFQLVMVQHENFLRSFLSLQYGLDKAKKPFHAIVPLRHSKRIDNRTSTSILCTFERLMGV